MAEVFVSYARSDQDQVDILVEALSARGLDVFWDRQLIAGSEFSMELQQRIIDSGCTVVVWSRSSARSIWVRSEAGIAQGLGKLLAVTLDHATPPPPYDQLHSIDLTGWRGDGGHSGFLSLAKAVEDELGRTTAVAQETAATARSQEHGVSSLVSVHARIPEGDFDPASRVVVDASGQGDFHSLGDALEQVSDGAELLLRPGTYDERTLRLEGRYHLRAQEPGSVRIRLRPGSRIEILGSSWLENLTVEGQGETMATVTVLQGSPLLRRCEISSRGSVGLVGLVSGHPAVTDCRIHGGSGGIWVGVQASALIRRCELSGTDAHGLAVLQHGCAIVEDCRIHHHGDFGVVVQRAGRCQIERCEVFANVRGGVEFSAGSRGVIRACEVIENHQGIRVIERSDVLIDDCFVARSELAGIYVQSDSRARIEHCRVRSNGEVGISAQGCEACVIDDTEVSGSSLSGVWARDAENVAIRGSRLHDNAEFGAILVSSRAELDGNSVLENRMTGIGIRGTGAHGEIRGNRIQNNGEAGIRVSEKAQARVRNNDIQYNGLSGIICLDGSSASVVGNRLDDNADHGMKVSASQATAQDNQVRHNRLSGLTACENGRVQFLGNQIDGNVEHGVYIFEGGHAEVRDNHIAGCGFSGIALNRAATAVVTANTIVDCAYVGIWVDDASRAEIDGNTIEGSGRSGVSVTGQSSATVRDNQIRNNAQAAVLCQEGSDVVNEANRMEGHAMGNVVRADVEGAPLRNVAIGVARRAEPPTSPPPPPIAPTGLETSSRSLIGQRSEPSRTDRE
jgi:parallel beta-helix repeat protein